MITWKSAYAVQVRVANRSIQACENLLGTEKTRGPGALDLHIQWDEKAAGCSFGSPCEDDVKRG